MKLYLVGYEEYEGLVFDSIWSTLELAQAYTGPESYTNIYEVELDATFDSSWPLKKYEELK